MASSVKCPIISTNINCVGKSPLDFFSIGHLVMGQISFLVLDTFILPSTLIDRTAWILWISLVVALFWEVFENVFMFQKGWKFEGRQDSFGNALIDVVLVVFGAGISILISPYAINMVLIVGELLTFGLIRTRTMHSKVPF